MSQQFCVLVFPILVGVEKPLGQQLRLTKQSVR